MIFIKYVAILLILFLNNAYAGPPEYFFYPPLFENRETLNNRIKKYDPDNIILKPPYLLVSYEGKLLIPKEMRFFFENYRVAQRIIPYAILSEQEKQYLITFFNVITDDEQKSKHIFDEFYKNHLQEYYKAIEKCNEESCRFRSFIIIDGIEISGWGETLSNSQYAPYLFRTIYVHYPKGSEN